MTDRCDFYNMKNILTLVLLIFTMLPAQAEVIDFNYILKQSIKNSYALNITKVDAQISESGIMDAKSEYYPTLSGYLTAERSNDLTNGTSQTSFIGNEAILSNDRYQNAASLGLSYNIFDFGVRSRKVKIAKEDKEQKEVIYNQELRDLKLKLVDTYAKSLFLYKERKIKQELLNIQSDLYQINERLNVAGKVPKTEVLNEAVKLAELMTDVNNVKKEYVKSLKELSFYTNVDFDAEDIEIEDFKETDENNGFVNVSHKTSEPIKIGAEVNKLLIEKTPEYKLYELELAKKKKELEIVKRKNLPSLKFDTRYYLYGTNPNNPWESMGDLSQRSMSFRVMSVMPIFDGFKTKAQKQKTKLEIEKIKISKAKALAELTQEFEKVKQDSQTSAKNLEKSYESLKLVEENIDIIEKLKENKLIGQADYLNKKASLLNKKLDFERNKIQSYIAQYKIRVLKGMDN